MRYLAADKIFVASEAQLLGGRGVLGDLSGRIVCGIFKIRLDRHMPPLQTEISLIFSIMRRFNNACDFEKTFAPRKKRAQQFA